jgi:putative adhesin
MTDNEQYRDPAEIRHRIGATGAFNLANVSGDIRIRGTDGDEAIVQARGRGRNEWLPINVRKGEGVLSIEIDQKGPGGFLGWRGRNDVEVEFDIVLPRAARVDVNAVSSDLDATEMVGDQSYRTVSGDIVLMRTGGRLSVTTVSGDAEVNADEAIEADLNSTSGDLQLTGPLLRATKLRTVSGDVEVRGGFEAGAMHGIETVSGDCDIESSTGLTVEVRKGIDLGGGPKQRVVGDGAARLRFRSLSGDLHVMAVGGERAVKDQRQWPPSPSTPPGPSEPPVRLMPLTRPAPPAQGATDSLAVLQALERGEIDVEEAQRRLGGA